MWMGLLRGVILNRIDAFERSFDSDMTYAREIVAADPEALLKLEQVRGVARYRKDVPADVYFATKLVAVLSEDCGPCTQLVVTMALRAGVEPQVLSNILAGNDSALSEPVLLAVQYTRATLARDAAADPLREQLKQRYGARGIVSLAFALVSSRLYPMLKYALGHGQVCRRVVVGEQTVAVTRAPLSTHSA
jgi:hypothetical protein